MSKIENQNVQLFRKWLFRKTDNLDQIVFIFVSKKNATNLRFMPLFEASQNVRIVVFYGLSIRYFDRVILKVMKVLIRKCRSKIDKYTVFHMLNLELGFKNKIQILHIDDPTYSVDELEQILSWQTHLKNNLAIIICTNEYTEKFYKSAIPNITILIIEQGFHDVQLLNHKLPLTNFSCVYSSPYIHYGSDLHGADSSWGSSELIDNIIPLLNNNIPDIQIHLIGEIGKHAREKLNKCNNIHLYGRVDPLTNIEILKKCSLGIYPRTHDNKRSVLKILSYIGAGLPVVTYDLIDTEVIKINSLGFSVDNVADFVDKIKWLRDNPEGYMELERKVIDFRNEYTWGKLAIKMQKSIENFYHYDFK
jgi:glycosyltransferase involved in cell wall biosynthesis